MSNSIITDAALRYMESNTLDYINLWRFMESSRLFEFSLINLYKTRTPDSSTLVSGASYINLSNLKLNKNRALTALGTYITINEIPGEVYRFPSVRNLYTREDVAAKVTPILESLKNRGSSRKKSFHVFVNGLKVPDEQAFVFASQKATELYLSSNWFIDEQNGSPYPNNIACVDKDFRNIPYNNFYREGVTSSYIVGIPLTTTVNGVTKRIVPSNTLLNNKNIVNVWVNNKHVSSDKYEINTISGSTTFDIRFLEPPASGGYSLEVIIDPTILGRYSENMTDNNNKTLVYLPKNADEIKADSSIFVHMTDVYVGGLRICHDYLVQKTHRHILVNKPLWMSLDTSETEIVLSDKSEVDTSMAQYINDFMEYEKWGSDEDNAKAILDMDSNLIVSPSFVSSARMVYPPSEDVYYKLDTMVNTHLPNDTKALKMLEENSHYLKNLLKYYAIKEESYTERMYVDSTPSTANIILDLDNSDKYNVESRMMEVHTNGLKIPSGNTSLITKYNTDMISIPRNLIGNDLIMYRYPSMNNKQKYLKLSAAIFADNLNQWVTLDPNVDFSIEGDIGDFNADELSVFTIADRNTDTSHLFLNFTGGTTYYKIVENQGMSQYLLRSDPLDSTKLQMKIPTGSSISTSDTLYITNPKFHGCNTYKIVDMDEYSTSRILLNTVVNGDIVPLVIGDYLIKVYKNGTLMLPEIDWFISTPTDLPNTTSSTLVFKTIIEDTDIIEVEYTGIKNKYLASYISVPKSNKYGFIFFDKLQIPFSLDYMDLYVNGRKLNDSDIVVYSDRLIRVNENTSLPFYDIVLCTRFKIDYENFTPFIEKANENICDFDEYIKRFCSKEIFEFSYDMDVISDIDINTIFEEKADFTDSEKIPNPIVDREIFIRFDTLMNRLQHDYNRELNLMSKYFDSNVYKSIVSAEYLMLVSKEYMEGHYIRFDSNSEKEQMAKTWFFDPNAQYRTRGETLKLIVDMFKSGESQMNNIINSNTILNDEHQLFKKYIYKSDFLALDSNYTFDKKDNITKNLILNSNNIVWRNKQ